MKESKKIPMSCNKCLEEVMRDVVEEKELDWERYGRELPQCQQCLDALKESMEKPIEQENLGDSKIECA